MLIEREFSAPAGAGQVWELFANPERLAGCIPGCRAVRRLDAGRSEADIEVALPFMRLPFTVRADLRPLEPRRRLHADVVGEPRALAGLLRAMLEVALSEPVPGRTLVRVRMDFRLSGRLASLGEAMLRSTVMQNAETFARNMQALLAREAGAAGTAPAATRTEAGPERGGG